MSSFQLSEVKWSAVQCSAVQCSAVKWSDVMWCDVMLSKLSYVMLWYVTWRYVTLRYVSLRSALVCSVLRYYFLFNLIRYTAVRCSRLRKQHHTPCSSCRSPMSVSARIAPFFTSIRRSQIMPQTFPYCGRKKYDCSVSSVCACCVQSQKHKNLPGNACSLACRFKSDVARTAPWDTEWLTLCCRMLRNEIAPQTSIIGLKVNNAEKEAIVPGYDPRIPPKLHRQTLLCASMWCPQTSSISRSKFEERATPQHDILCIQRLAFWWFQSTNTQKTLLIKSISQSTFRKYTKSFRISRFDFVQYSKRLFLKSKNIKKGKIYQVKKM